MALGRDDFGGVGGKWDAPFAIFFGDHLKNVAELSERGFASRHQRATASEGGDLRDPGTIILAVKDRFVVVQRHRSYRSLSLAV